MAARARATTKVDGAKAGDPAAPAPEVSTTPANGVADVPGGRDDADRLGRVVRAAELFRHVGDPTRLAILLMLAEGERNVGVLCDRVGQAQPATSHHLAVLRLSRLIAVRAEGRRNFYRLTPEGERLARVAGGLVGGMGD